MYDWKVHAADGYRWWTERIRRAFSLYDVVRIDHFRGFDRYYEIDAGEETAVGGRWRKGPGYALFYAIEQKLGRLDFIAEDLGTLDVGVYRLMKKTGYPGMKVLEFAFDGNPQNPYLPSNIAENSVCYTGTHDNDTLLSFFENMSEGELKAYCARIRDELKKAGISRRVSGAKSAAESVVELALACRSSLSVVPLQDVLLNGSRMNTPSTSQGNWIYRAERLPSDKDTEKLNALLVKHGRV